MRNVNRRVAMKLAAAGAALAVGAVAAPVAEGAKADERAVTSYRVNLHNWTGKEVSIRVFGGETTLSTQVAPAWEAFKVVGSSYIPAGEYVYVARTNAGNVVAYGKVTIDKQASIWFWAGVDNYSFTKRYSC